MSLRDFSSTTKLKWHVRRDPAIYEFISSSSTTGIAARTPCATTPFLVRDGRGASPLSVDIATKPMSNLDMSVACPVDGEETFLLPLEVLLAAPLRAVPSILRDVRQHVHAILLVGNALGLACTKAAKAVKIVEDLA